ncbi:uncharacterized protein LOC106996755 isoform X2 [Macaca mulatta]
MRIRTSLGSWIPFLSSETMTPQESAYLHVLPEALKESWTEQLSVLIAAEKSRRRNNSVCLLLGDKKVTGILSTFSLQLVLKITSYTSLPVYGFSSFSSRSSHS